MNSLKMSEIVLKALLVAAALGIGCVARASGHASAYAEAEPPIVFEAPPTLVLVDSDVWVVRDYGATVYYYDGFYWHYREGIWYRASSYNGGWMTVEVSVVPQVIVRRDHRIYVHYHGEASARTRRAPPAHAAARHGGPPGHH